MGTCTLHYKHHLGFCSWRSTYPIHPEKINPHLTKLRFNCLGKFPLFFFCILPPIFFLKDCLVQVFVLPWILNRKFHIEKSNTWCQLFAKAQILYTKFKLPYSQNNAKLWKNQNVCCVLMAYMEENCIHGN